MRKKILSLLLALLLVLTLVSCGDEDDSSGRDTISGGKKTKEPATKTEEVTVTTDAPEHTTAVTTEPDTDAPESAETIEPETNAPETTEEAKPEGPEDQPEHASNYRVIRKSEYETNSYSDVWNNLARDYTYYYDENGHFYKDVCIWGDSTITTEYNESGKPAKKTTESNGYYSYNTYTYYENGLLKSDTFSHDWGTSTTEYEHNDAGFITKMIMSDGETWEYGYDADGNQILFQAFKDGELTERAEYVTELVDDYYITNSTVKDGDGTLISTSYAKIKYDSNGNILHLESSSEYLSENYSVNSIIDYTYDEAGRLIKETTYYADYPANTIYTYEFDAYGNLTTFTTLYGSDGSETVGQVVKYEYEKIEE